MATFTKDWFSTNIPRWEKHLAHFKKKPCAAIELGCYEGRSACWMLDNILLHNDSTLECVETKPLPLLRENLKPYKQASLHVIDATAYLIHVHNRNRYDVAYIDADHTARDVIMQLGLLWPRMRAGGIVILDDYDNPRFEVRAAVDFFMRHWTGCRALYMHHQAMIQKE